MALQIFCCLVAAEFAYIFYLETVIPDSGTTAKVFGMDVKDLKMPAMKTAMKNQGVYNLGIAVLLILAAFCAPQQVCGCRAARLYCLCCPLWKLYCQQNYYPQAGRACHYCAYPVLFLGQYCS